jgi:hypothetical protein
MARNGSQTLSDVTSDYLTVTCSKCGRHGRYAVARLWRERGDIMLTTFLDEVSADCPRLQAASFYDRCGAHYDFSG